MSNVFHKIKNSIYDYGLRGQIYEISNEKKPLGYLMASILFD
ncbi:hypothetical protein VCHA50P415_190024 [Vibrio chagasii]|nr:hypothetical protein VCHA27O13_360029 [Vibrio chagasii]CAH6798436.1 hypothetical protein VCHA36P166_100081 [Vibrio chagasii]CAH6801250.1 hypothetical protein VCHA34P131_110080 [Vibrio chagasii]CAH6810119.1 hypothetical protein VCHA34P114_130080 [Vibrio chagasii]CAH6811892.1 hypothetical protein VCHA36O157_140024 [Vibrio chagasii]